MDEGGHKKTEPEPEFKPLKKEPAFKSSFKRWIRMVAFLVVAVFLPEQVAQAVEYDWRVIWQKPAIYTPSYLKDIRDVDIPLAIRNILQDISGKPINAIKISPTLTVELEKPLNISKQRIEEIYNWLKGKPCGAKALYEFLSYKGLSPKGTDPKVQGTVPTLEQDVAVLTLTIDILNDVVKPEGNPRVIKNSLYALSRASEFFSHKLYPVKFEQGESPAGTVPVPFIAHLKSDHYILVTRITEEKVYFVDEHKEEFLPREKFIQEFSGYMLTQGESPAGTVPVADNEAKKILGARSYKGEYADLSPLFREPSISEQLMALGFTLGTAVIGGWGGGMSGMVTAFGTSAFTSQVGGALTTVAQREFGWGPTSSAIFGAAVSSGLSMGISTLSNPPTLSGFEFDPGRLGIFRYAPDSLQSLAVAHPFIVGFATGTAMGAVQSGLQFGVSNALGDRIDSSFRYGLASLIGSVGTTFAFNALMGALPGDRWNGETQFTAWSAIKDTWNINNNALPKYLITQGIGLGIEYLASQTGFIKPEYSRILGQGLGSLTSGMIFNDTTSAGQWFSSDNKTWQMIGNSLITGAVNAGVTIGLTKLTNSVENREFLHAAMPYMTMFASSALYAAYHSFTGSDMVINPTTGEPMLRADAEQRGLYELSSLGFTDIMRRQLSNMSVEYLTFGRTSPFTPAQYLQGQPYTTFNFALHNAKMWDFIGLTYYPDAARRVQEALRKEGTNPDEWRRQQILPDFMQSLVFYNRSFANAQAANTFTDLFRDIYANQLGGDRWGAYRNNFVRLSLPIPWTEDLTMPVELRYLDNYTALLGQNNTFELEWTRGNLRVLPAIYNEYNGVLDELTVTPVTYRGWQIDEDGSMLRTYPRTVYITPEGKIARDLPPPQMTSWLSDNRPENKFTNAISNLEDNLDKLSAERAEGIIENNLPSFPVLEAFSYLDTPTYSETLIASRYGQDYLVSQKNQQEDYPRLVVISGAEKILLTSK